MIKDSGERTEFGTGAVRDMHSGKGRMDLLPWEALVEVSKHCEEGALKYGERNCEKGIPIHSLIDSAFRHLAKYMMGMKDEPHLRAAAWNILFALYMEIKHPELQDIPTRIDKSENPQVPKLKRNLNRAAVVSTVTSSGMNPLVMNVFIKTMGLKIDFTRQIVRRMQNNENYQV